ncbi:uncharacterized protein LOC136081530 [Hydra vulgaris]|uniref:Uncharacterized protein LOC136081530 n=1 Tax=Hydra vulgaris TaxID=6087 RepID=A0ABM4C078_HYDVU
MHLPGMNFAGPGTNLDERLTSTDTYKEWTDKIMIEEMDAIKNPTIRERIERGVIKPIISSKAKFGLGLSDPYEMGVETTQKNYKRSVDKGLEFYNKRVKTLGVELYSTENEEKSCVVECWNRTMKDKMFKYFSANSTRKYIDVLDEIVNKYNNTKHSSIKMTLVEASDKKNDNIVWLNLNRNVRSESVKPKFSISDRVRITKKKGTSEKGYTPRWTEEVFTVSQVQFTDPPTYKITDDNSEEIQGTFYEQEMQKYDQNIFRIEKVIRKLKNKSLVKWYGYPESFNSWVDNKELISLKN